jgi:FtsH-binding integral membrane protein
MKRLWIPQTIACVMLLWALYPENPYGYYVLLRVVCCGVFAFLAFQAFAQEKQGWSWTLAITALVYNPIFRIHLTRAIWSAVNIATIVVAVASIFILRQGERKQESE